MHIKRLRIKNFKGLKSAVFEPTRFSCLVGENNSGKSSVLQAIVLGLNRPTQLQKALYYDETLPVEISLTFSDISSSDLSRLAEEHREKIEPLIESGSFTLIVRYPVDEKVETKVLSRAPIEERFKDDRLDELFKAKKGAAVRQTVVEFFPELAEVIPETT